MLQDFEIFYIVKVIAVKIAECDISDIYLHQTIKGQSYLQCYYLEKTDEHLKKGIVLYKVINGEVYVLPAEVFYPGVKLDDKLRMSYKDYLFLADCT